MDALGPGRSPQIWLIENLGDGNAQFWAFRSPFVGDAFALYTRTLKDAAAFLAAFPEFEIADGTESVVYSSPSVSGGQRHRGRR